MEGLTIFSLLIGIGIAVLLAVDSSNNKVGSPVVWGILGFFFGLITLIVYYAYSRPKALKAKAAAQQPFAGYGPPQQQVPWQNQGQWQQVPAAPPGGQLYQQAPPAPPGGQGYQPAQPQGPVAVQAASTKSCPHCGQQGLPLDAAFCGKCGRPITA